MTKHLQNRITGYHWIIFLVCFVATIFGGVISTLMSVYLPVAVADLLGNAAEARLNTISAYINAVFIIGGALGGFIAGYITDIAGRKPGLILSILCCSLFTIATGYMQDWTGVVICRLFTGVGLGALLVTTNVLLIEIWPAKSRAIVVGVLSIGIPIGIFSAGVIDYLVSSWRDAFLVGTLPLTIAVGSIFFLKESPAWQKGSSKANPEHRPAEIAVSYRKNLWAGSLIFGAMLIGLWAIFSWLPTWITTLAISGDGQQERGISMMMLGMGGLAGGFVSGWVNNLLGARRSLLICFAACFLLSFVLFRTNQQFTPYIYPQICLLAICFGISQGILGVFIPSLFPVANRGRATGICFNAGRVLTAIAVLFVGVLVDRLGGYGNSLFVFSLVFIAGWLVTLLIKAEHHDEIIAELSSESFNTTIPAN